MDMESILYYLLRASVLMAIFYVFYTTLFSRNTFHAMNRFLLIGLATVSLCLPLFRFRLLPVKAKVPVFDHLLAVPAAPVAYEASAGAVATIPWVAIFMGLFLAGFLFTVLRYLIGLGRLTAIIRTSNKKVLEEGSVLCETDQAVAPFSWHKFIVLSQGEAHGDHSSIVHHEKAHVSLNHTWDRVLFDFITCLFWFNPFSWLLRREIQSVHEYQADEWVLQNGFDTKQYQLLLIRKSVGEQKFALASNLRRRDLHKRIEMMMKNKSNKRVRWSYAMLLPVLFLALITLSAPKLNAQLPNANPVEAVDKDPVITARVMSSDTLAPQQVVTSIRALALPPVNGDTLVQKPLVIVDGKRVSNDVMNTIKPDDIGAIEVLKDISAVDLYGEDAKSGAIVITMKNKGPSTMSDALYIIDGVKMGADFNINSIKPDEIKSISVLKEDSGTAMYGEEGKNGVILIELK